MPEDGRADELARLGWLLRRVRDETNVALTREKSEQIFQAIMTKLERRQRRWHRRLGQALQARWRHFRASVATRFHHAPHET